MERGILNNNPGNIRRSATKWHGLKKVQFDKVFCQFETMAYGIRAFFVLMKTYRYKYGLKTPREIIKRYAPASENNVPAYLLFLEYKGLVLDNELRDDSMYCVFAKYVFLYESRYSISVSSLHAVMQSMDCYVVNKRKECYELNLY